jgi:hypothetical protein
LEESMLYLRFRTYNARLQIYSQKLLRTVFIQLLSSVPKYVLCRQGLKQRSRLQRRVMFTS